MVLGNGADRIESNRSVWGESDGGDHQLILRSAGFQKCPSGQIRRRPEEMPSGAAEVTGRREFWPDGRTSSNKMKLFFMNRARNFQKIAIFRASRRRSSDLKFNKVSSSTKPLAAGRLTCRAAP